MTDPPRVCDTYTVWTPTGYTITARCSCGWAGTTLPQEQVVESTAEEMDHLWQALERLRESEKEVEYG